jgi:hypothetical protein
MEDERPGRDRIGRVLSGIGGPGHSKGGEGRETDQKEDGEGDGGSARRAGAIID